MTRLKSESDMEVKTEIERRLKLLDPKQAGLVECSLCKKTFPTAQNEKIQTTLLPRMF